jgi:hypothetical protein
VKTLNLILRGGVGNQLFQYFAGVELARQQERILVIDNSWYQRRIHLNGMLDARKYELDSYSFEENLVKTTKIKLQNDPRIERLSKAMPRWIGLSLGQVEELQSMERSSRRKLTTFGHWINQDFIPNHKMAHELLIGGLRSASSTYSSLVSEMNAREIAALHIRLGDYLKFKDVYGTTGSDYYRKVLSSEELRGQEIWLFSDYPDSALEILAGESRIDRVVTNEYALSSAETIALIAHAKNIVASNSTFSWWAGYISQNSQVFFPKQYMVGLETRRTGLFVPEWTYL